MLGVNAQQGTLALDPNESYSVLVGASVARNFTDLSTSTTTAVAVDLMETSVEMRVYNQSGNFFKVPIKVNAVLESGSSQDFAIYLRRDLAGEAERGQPRADLHGLLGQDRMGDQPPAAHGLDRHDHRLYARSRG